MDLINLKEMVSSGFTNREIGENIGFSTSYVSKLLKKNNIKRPHRIIHTHCGLCNIDLGENKRNRSNCKRCAQRISRYRRKLKCVEYKGGECERCGYDKYISALEFHHKNSNEKDFSVSRNMCNDFEDVKKELDKCELLCSNCHREEHANYDDDKLLNYISGGSSGG